MNILKHVGKLFQEYYRILKELRPQVFVFENVKGLVSSKHQSGKKLIEVIGENQLSVKEMLVGMGLKDRPNFLEYTLSPAMKEGYVRMLYPDSPRHPRQKYQLTVKGLAAYKEIS